MAAYAGWYVPIRHVSHTSKPSAEKVPGMHSPDDKSPNTKHSEISAMYTNSHQLIGLSEQCVLLDTIVTRPLHCETNLVLFSDVDVLGGHQRHLSWPSSGWYMPMPQPSHAFDTTLKNVPSGHLTESDDARNN